MENPQPAPGQSIGKGMLYLFWIGILAAATLYFSSSEQQKTNPNQQVRSQYVDGVAEVTLKRNNRGHYIANGQVNGQQVTFLLDTGATLVVIPAAQADKLGLSRMARSRSSTANGEVDVYLTRIDTLKLGNIVMKDVPASITPNMDAPILLGMSFLKHLEMTQSGNTLTLRQ